MTKNNIEPPRLLFYTRLTGAPSTPSTPRKTKRGHKGFFSIPP
jgi:hypothetical protein